MSSHRQRMIASSGFFPLDAFLTVPCLSQAPISLCLATAMRCWSALLKSLRRTSTRFFFAPVTNNTLSSADPAQNSACSSWFSTGISISQNWQHLSSADMVMSSPNRRSSVGSRLTPACEASPSDSLTLSGTGTRT